MKAHIFIILIVLVVGMTVFCGGTAEKEKKDSRSQAQQLVGGVLGGKVGDTLLETKIKAITGALDLYYTDNNEYPEMLDELVPSYLRTKTELLDPWDTPFELETDDEMNLVIVSAGKDKTFETDDDIKRSI